MAERERDEVTGTETTGHEWDGIKELDTPLPRWWLWTFYATIIWGIGYTIAYPAWPLLESNTKGLLGTTNRLELHQEMKAVQQARAEKLQQLENLSLQEIRSNEELFQFANRMGAASFKVNCVQCHQAGGQGAFGYPNLADDDWLWGGKLEDIHYSITHGIRYQPDTNPETRQSEMPAFGRDQILEPKQIEEVVEYVLKLSGQEHDAAKAEAGKKVYMEDAGCNACHGDNGEGNQELGGPRLNDQIWLFGGTREQIRAQVHTPQHGVMPAWKGKLDKATIKALTIYVHSLGGGVGS